MMKATTPMRRDDVRPKLGLDLDGCVFAFDLGACLALKLRGVDIEVRESYHWDDIQRRVPPEDWTWLWHAGVRNAFEHAPAYPGVATQLRKMQELVDFVVITHRPRGVIDITLRKLADLRIRPIAVYHVQGQDKSLIAPDCIAYVDDRVENVRELLENTDAEVFMPVKPWNSELHHDDAPRFHPYFNMEEVTQWVKNHV